MITYAILIICRAYFSIFYLVYELPEDGTDMLKHVGVVKDHTCKCVLNLCIDLVLYMNAKQNVQNE
jgi:hypothetical protein